MNFWTLISILVVAYVFYIYVRYFAPLRRKENGFPFVYVEADASVRELSEDEKEYLNTEFNFQDGNRPYIKSRYRSLTPDQQIHGYILRRRVPFWIEIK